MRTQMVLRLAFVSLCLGLAGQVHAAGVPPQMADPERGGPGVLSPDELPGNAANGQVGRSQQRAAGRFFGRKSGTEQTGDPAAGGPEVIPGGASDRGAGGGLRPEFQPGASRGVQGGNR